MITLGNFSYMLLENTSTVLTLTLLFGVEFFSLSDKSKILNTAIDFILLAKTFGKLHFSITKRNASVEPSPKNNLKILIMCHLTKILDFCPYQGHHNFWRRVFYLEISFVKFIIFF